MLMTQSDLKVFITTGESSCGECGQNLGRRAWITRVEDQGALCLSCADLDHLLFLPVGGRLPSRNMRVSNTAAGWAARPSTWKRKRSG
jgi:hypothetical protein